MHTPTTRRQPEYQLRDNAPMRLANAAGRRVECLSGMAWITAYGEAADITLRAGDVFVVPNQGLALLEAVGAARVRIHQPAGVLQALLDLIGAALVRLGQNLQAGSAPCTDAPK